MGNSVNKSSTYICNILPTKNNQKRNSLSLPKRNIDIKRNTANSFITNEYFQNQNQIENGGKIIDMRNSYNINLETTQKQNKQFILLSPLLKENNKNKKDYISKSNIKNIENQKRNTFSKYNDRINNSNKNTKYIITDLKHNFNYEDNYSNKNNDKIYAKNNKENNNQSNTSTDEENTINNCSLSNNSINTNNSIHESLKDINQTNNKNNSNINTENNIEENEIKTKTQEKNSEINEIKDLEENEEISDEEGEISEKEIELFEQLNKPEEKNENNKKEYKEIENLIKGLKAHNFNFSRKSRINLYHTRKLSICNLIRPLIKGQNEQNINNLNNSSHSIPEARHIDPNHPLNFLLIKRNIKSSLFPLNKNSFNVVTYKEDNSKQYAFFENGVSNGVTRFIISKKYNIVFEGFLEDGFPKGYGKYSLFDEGKYYEGIWDKTLLLGTETWKDGTMYIGEFNNNKREGIGMYRWPDGTIYSGEWKNDIMEGFCSIKYEDNRKYEGQMKNGLKNGYGEFTWKNIRKYFGYYLNDLKDGFGIYVWNIKTFEVYIGFWYKGKMEGIGMIIKDDRKRYGKWSRGERIEKYKNERELKLKYKSTEFAMATNLINQRVKVTDYNKQIVFDNNNAEMFKRRKSVIKIAKSQIEGCINFMCQDLKTIKNIILSFFLKPYSYA